jgi:hypothetical protein
MVIFLESTSYTKRCSLSIPLTYYNEDEETPEPAVYEEPEEDDGLDILNTPFTLLLDPDALPDSLKANLPPGGSLPALPENRIVGPPVMFQTCW